MNSLEFSIQNHSIDMNVNVSIRVINKKKQIVQQISKHNKATRNMTEGIIRFLRGEFNTTFLREFSDSLKNIGNNSEIARQFIPTHMGIGNIGVNNDGEVMKGVVYPDIYLPSYSDKDLRQEIVPANNPHRVEIQKSVKDESVLSDTYSLSLQGYYQFNQKKLNDNTFKFIYANTIDEDPKEVVLFENADKLKCVTVTELGLYSGDIGDSGSRLLARLLLSSDTPLIISENDTVVINWLIGINSLNDKPLFTKSTNYNYLPSNRYSEDIQVVTDGESTVNLHNYPIIANSVIVEMMPETEFINITYTEDALSFNGNNVNLNTGKITWAETSASYRISYNYNQT